MMREIVRAGDIAAFSGRDVFWTRNDVAMEENNHEPR
jgi:hypothetical protein